MARTHDSIPYARSAVTGPEQEVKVMANADEVDARLAFLRT